MTVLRIIPTGDGKTHEVRRDEQVLGEVAKMPSAGEPPWAFRFAEQSGFSEGRWLSRSAAAVALSERCDAPGVPL